MDKQHPPLFNRDILFIQVFYILIFYKNSLHDTASFIFFFFTQSDFYSIKKHL